MATLLLVHGWNYRHYTSSGCTDAWSERADLVKALAAHYEIIRINLPGFGGEPDPPFAWDLLNYVHHVEAIIRRLRPDAALGYSFGGAILLKWKLLRDDRRVATILVSPAIARRYTRRKPWLPLARLIPDSARRVLRDVYLSRIVRNPYHSAATPVMRETYRLIVKHDLREELANLRTPITLVFGEHDTATPPELVAGTLAHEKSIHKLEVIRGGNHNIGATHIDAVVDAVLRSAPVRQ